LRGSFVSGVLLGMLGGAVIGMMYNSRTDSSTAKYLWGKAKKIGKKRGIVMKEMAQSVHDWMDN